ncbi:MAG: hypothetical protein JW918_12385, partial [Anaerolineae bacterium]|nr:hypothetical protein [Anaerolineae bacterium]
TSVTNVTRIRDGCTIRFNMGLPPGLEPGLAFRQAYQGWPLLASQPKFARVQNGNKRVKVTSRRGSIEAEAWVADRVPPGMVFSNFHFPEASANELTIAALEPVAKIPEYKVCAVKVELA